MKWRLLCFTAALLLACQAATAQVEMSEELSVQGPPSLFLEALSFAANDSGGSRLDLFLQVGYDNLTFVKVGDTYDASYEVTATLVDSMNVTAAEQDWSEQIRGIPFDATVAPGAFKVSQRVFQLAPGKYQLVIQIRDNENKAVRRLQRNVVVPLFSKPGLSLSSIMLVSRITHEGGKKNILPSISPNVGTIPGSFYAFFEAYDRGHPDSLVFQASILNKKDDVLATFDTSQALHAGRNDVFIRLSHDKLPVGDYKLVIAATRPGESNSLAATARAFVVRWRGLPMGTDNLDLAIEQMRYLARDSELDSLKRAKTEEEKQRLFLDFWKRRDPNPNTPRNERMEEYYARVEYANRHFSHYREGWRTDMGMIYIIFGPPNNVERHPFDMDSKPYEVWSYYDINQVFVFADETGFGDYRLTTPLWEVWRRPR